MAVVGTRGEGGTVVGKVDLDSIAAGVGTPRQGIADAGAAAANGTRGGRADDRGALEDRERHAAFVDGAGTARYRGRQRHVLSTRAERSRSIAGRGRGGFAVDGERVSVIGAGAKVAAA